MAMLDTSKTAASLPVDDQLCFSLYATSMAITRVYKPILDRFGLTYPQYLVLSTLWQQDDRTIGTIADHLSLESSTVTPLVKRLEAAGLVGRMRNPADERQVRVRLTDAGRDLQVSTTCLGEMLVERTGMSFDQLTSLNAQIRELRVALGTVRLPADD